MSNLDLICSPITFDKLNGKNNVNGFICTNNSKNLEGFEATVPITKVPTTKVPTTKVPTTTVPTTVPTKAPNFLGQWKLHFGRVRDFHRDSSLKTPEGRILVEGSLIGIDWTDMNGNFILNIMKSKKPVIMKWSDNINSFNFKTYTFIDSISPLILDTDILPELGKKMFFINRLPSSSSEGSIITLSIIQ